MLISILISRCSKSTNPNRIKKLIDWLVAINISFESTFETIVNLNWNIKFAKICHKHIHLFEYKY